VKSSSDFCPITSQPLVKRNTIWIESICISYVQAPAKDVIDELQKLFNCAMERSDFFFVKSSIKLLERVVLGNQDAHRGWITMIAALKLAINNYGREKYCVKMFR